MSRERPHDLAADAMPLLSRAAESGIRVSAAGRGDTLVPISEPMLGISPSDDPHLN